MLKINTRELKKKVGTLKSWCLEEGINYNSFSVRVCRGTKDPTMEAIIKSGADLNKILEVE